MERSKDSLQQMVTSCSWTMRLAGVERAELSSRWWRPCWPPIPSPSPGSARAARSCDDLRPSVLALAVADAGRTASADPSGRTVGLVAELRTQPRGVRPVELVRGLIAVSGDSADRTMDGRAEAGRPGSIPVLDRACRTQQWIERDGHPSGAAPRAGSSRPGPTAPRTPWSVRREQY